MSRTEALQRALEAVYSGSQQQEAECVLDHIRDAGFDVVWRPGLQVDPPHNIVSWIESHLKGWFQCSCGEEFITEGFDSEDKSMGALFVQHLAAVNIGDAGAPRACRDQVGQERGLQVESFPAVTSGDAGEVA